jgi:hypothetical protein
MATLASNPAVWRVAMSGGVYGIDSTELLRRLGGSDEDQAVVTRLMMAAERGIVTGHAERMAKIDTTQSKMAH